MNGVPPRVVNTTYLHLVHVKNTVWPSSADRSCSVAYDMRSLPHFGHLRSTTGPSSSFALIGATVDVLAELNWIVYSTSMLPNTMVEGVGGWKRKAD